MSKLGFIGTGNMGSALVYAATKKISPYEILISNRTSQKSSSLSKEVGCVISNNSSIASSCKYIILGVKPQMLNNVLADISKELETRNPKPVLVTMAAGVAINTICKVLGEEYPIIRIMPNTPVSIGEGMILYTANNLVTDALLLEFIDIFSAAGNFDKIDESLIDAGSAISGCGPAFAYLMLEALADGGVMCGLSKATAIKYAAQMMLGASKMVLESEKHPAILKDAVCSPAGSTIAGVSQLENSAFRAATINAVVASFKRTVELGK